MTTIGFASSEQTQHPMLVAKAVCKTYGTGAVRHQALRGVSFAADNGEFIALRGPSGCGKSTLLHILGAMDRPTSGEVWLSGRRLDTLSLDQLAAVRRRNVGFIFQAFNLLPTLNALENVSLPLRLDRIPEREAQDRAWQALHDVDLIARGKHQPSQLSGGELQRVAIARALAMRPQLILADEPTGSLDSVNGSRVLELMAELNRSRQITIIMATHSREAAAYAQRTLNVKDGLFDGQADRDVHASEADENVVS